MQRKVLDTNWW